MKEASQTQEIDDALIDDGLSQLKIPSADDLTSFLNQLNTSPELVLADNIFSNYPKSSLLEPRSRSLIYFLTRFTRPQLALEIGTFKAGTSEIIARAIRMNGRGALITIDPFGAKRVPPIIQAWPPSLTKHIFYMPLSSMDSYIEFESRRLQFDFIFVDGDHSFEYALYDLQMAARFASPGALIIMDNAEQTGVYWAVKTFLSINTVWSELGSSIAKHDPHDPYHTMMPSFTDSSFLLLQAPTKIVINERPRSFTSSQKEAPGLEGFDLNLEKKHGGGVINAMVFFRSFLHGGYEGKPEQKVQILSIPVKEGETSLKVIFPEAFYTGHRPEHSFRLYEFVLSWSPDHLGGELELSLPPTPIEIP